MKLQSNPSVLKEQQDWTEAHAWGIFVREEVAKARKRETDAEAEYHTTCKATGITMKFRPKPITRKNSSMIMAAADDNVIPPGRVVCIIKQPSDHSISGVKP